MKKSVYNLVELFPSDLMKAYMVNIPKIKLSFNRIVILGMGGSYAAGLIIEKLIEHEANIPIEAKNEVEVIDPRTLYILISYSGNTKEIIQNYDLIKHEGVIVISSGGNLVTQIKKNKRGNAGNIVHLPKDLHQRFTIHYCVIAILKLLEKLKVISSKEEKIDGLVDLLETNRKDIENEAKRVSLKFKNKNPVIYSSDSYFPVAYRMMVAICEDAKLICHINKIPEIFHYEIEALPNKHYLPILLFDYESNKNKREYSFFKKKLKVFYELDYKKFSYLERFFIFLFFTEFLGFYLSKTRKKKMGETKVSNTIKKL